jgi:DNA helicase HerA-like ATPase
MEIQPNQNLGIVVAGSVAKGTEVRLDSSASVEDMVVGRYVTIEGKKRRFFGMVTDISLGVTDEEITISPPDTNDVFTAEILEGAATYGSLHILPMLTISDALTGVIEEPQPVKTLPSHFSRVKLASEADMERVFGKEDKSNFNIGNPLDMETKLCLNLEELVKRSNGIFGKSGTGKTFLTRLLLIGMLQKSKATNLIFDMHNEYGWAGSFEGGKGGVKALKQFFPSKVAVFTLDEENSRHRGVSTDFVVRIGYDEIEPEDISLLRQTLNLTDPAVEAVYQLKRHLGKGWMLKTLDMPDSDETEALLQSMNIHESTFSNLRRGLAPIRRLPFLVPHAQMNAVNSILEYLERGINVVLEFGRYRDTTAYMLVANMLASRIYKRYQEKTEVSMAGGITSPTPLVITIEEAHKFLNREIASYTIFGTIAREMRKYNVTLLVIDQRPSAIDEEVMSQLGTKITCLLDNEKDIEAVLAGVNGKNELKTVLARLAPKQQALIFGHAVPMPIAFRPRDWGTAKSYEEFNVGSASDKKAEKDIKELFE